jgi:hypothetical protein
MAERFAEAGFVFVKHNFSHDGTTVDHPTRVQGPQKLLVITTLKKSLMVFGVVIDWVCGDTFPIQQEELDGDQIYLIGHSRGGGIIMLKAGEDKRVKKIAPGRLWNEYGQCWRQDQMQQIKEDGVVYCRKRSYQTTTSSILADIPELLRQSAEALCAGCGAEADHTYADSAWRSKMKGSHSTSTELKAWKPDAELLTAIRRVAITSSAESIHGKEATTRRSSKGQQTKPSDFSSNNQRSSHRTLSQDRS